MPASSIFGLLQSLIPGFRLIDGQDLITFYNKAIGAQGNMTALAGGGQNVAPGNSNVLNFATNEVTTVVTAGDSVILPPALKDTQVEIINHAASNSMNYFGYPGINPATGVADQVYLLNSASPQAGSTAIAIAAGHAHYLICMRPGFWKQIITT